MSKNSSNKFINHLIEILEEVIHIIKKTESNHINTRWDNDEEVINELNSYINKLLNDSSFDINQVELLFGPTSSLHELSLDSGWSEGFHSIADKLDLRDF